MDIFLNKEIIDNLDLNNYDIATYVAIRSIYNADEEELYISTELLAYKLFGCSIPERASKQIKESILRLAEFGLFDIITILNKRSGNYVIKEKRLHLNTYDTEKKSGSYFTIITSLEVRTIMTLQTRKDKFALLRFFINVIGTFNRGKSICVGGSKITNFVGYMSQDYIGGLSGINRGVVEDYFNLLEDAEVLFVYRHNKAIRDDDGKMKSITNHYGRFEDRAGIKSLALEYEASVLGVDMKQSNKKRSLMAKYNRIVSDPDKYFFRYSENELIDIYKYVSNRNAREQALGFDDVRDLSVFDGVPCIMKYLNRDSSYEENQLLDDILNDDMWGETKGTEEMLLCTS